MRVTIPGSKIAVGIRAAIILVENHGTLFPIRRGMAIRESESVGGAADFVFRPRENSG
jgi:hypothetical protein